MTLNNFEKYTNYILATIFSFILSIFICDFLNINTFLGKFVILLINYIILYYLGKYIINKIK